MNGNEHATRTSGTTDRSLTEEVEVAVVGAGPTGLTLAVMLSGYGIRTAVLDGAAGPARHSRAAVVHARTLETLEPLGVVGEMPVEEHLGNQRRGIVGRNVSAVREFEPARLRWQLLPVTRLVSE